MERVDDKANLELLRRANQRFDHFFARFAGAPVLGTTEEVEALLQMEATLKSVGAFLDGRLQSSQADLVRDELACYRANLVRLREELARMQNAANHCRTQLSARQKNLHAAQAWCAASRSITS
jgi:DNA repair exonuclease SbcCD ATPase subunit